MVSQIICLPLDCWLSGITSALTKHKWIYSIIQNKTISRENCQLLILYNNIYSQRQTETLWIQTQGVFIPLVSNSLSFEFIWQNQSKLGPIIVLIHHFCFRPEGRIIQQKDDFPSPPWGPTLKLSNFHALKYTAYSHKHYPGYKYKEWWTMYWCMRRLIKWVTKPNYFTQHKDTIRSSCSFRYSEIQHIHLNI